MSTGFRHVLWMLVVGAGLGAFGGLMTSLIVPPADPAIYLGALAVGATLGACAAVWVMMRCRGIRTPEQPSETK